MYREGCVRFSVGKLGAHLAENLVVFNDGIKMGTPGLVLALVFAGTPSALLAEYECVQTS